MDYLASIMLCMPRQYFYGVSRDLKNVLENLLDFGKTEELSGRSQNLLFNV